MEHYALAQLIASRRATLGLSKAGLVQRMGFSNPGRGINRVDSWMEARKLPLGMQDRLASALEIDRAALDLVLTETLRQLRLEARERQRLQQAQERSEFLPHVCAMCERRTPSPIFIGIMTHGGRFAYFDRSFLQLSFVDQLTAAGTLIRDHYAHHERRIHGFGNILHYALRRDYDEAADELLLFDTAGTVLTNPAPDFERVPGRPGGLTVKGRRIDPLMHKLMGTG
jgi:hypothetical protein